MERTYAPSVRQPQIAIISEMEYYETNIKYHLRTLYDVIERIFLVGLVIIVIPVYFGAKIDITISESLFIIIVFFLVLVLPYLIVYFRYIKISKNILIIVNHEKEQIEVQTSNSFKSYSFDDVNCITKIVTSRAAKRKNSKSRWGDFFYFTIELKSKEEIIITSLMTNKTTIEISNKETNVEPLGIGWIPLKGRSIINLAAA